MTLWSDFVRKYADDKGITYSVAMKDPLVKEAYKNQKAEFLLTFEQKLAEAIEAYEAEVPLEEPLAVEVIEDSVVTVTYEIVDIPIPAPPIQTPRVFISKQKRGNH
jgi:hypothetical protein